MCVGAVSVTCAPQRHLDDAKVFAVGTTGCIYFWMSGLKTHVAEVAFSEVKLAQSSADRHPGRNTAQAS